jgi:hypothetical protein
MIDGNADDRHFAVGRHGDRFGGASRIRHCGRCELYRLQIRNGNDMFLSVPPNLTDAYPIADNIIRLTSTVTSIRLRLRPPELPLASATARLWTAPCSKTVRTSNSITSVRVHGDAETGPYSSSIGDRHLHPVVAEPASSTACCRSPKCRRLTSVP